MIRNFVPFVSCCMDPPAEAFLFASPPAERQDVNAWARQTLRREREAAPATAGEAEARAGWTC